ncbi:MAG: S41 family peptidase [Myxococcota bacterium]|nr:S41 family peptidase [Myxococcota bacterium]
MKYRVLTLFLAVSFVTVNHGFAQTKDTKSPLVCWSLAGLMARYHDSHVQFRRESGEINERVVELYAKRMDPSKVMLLADEFSEVKARIKIALASVQEGDCETFEWLRTEQIKWQSAMEDHVRKLVSEPTLTIDRSLSLQMDADKRERPRTNRDRAEARKKLIHFQLANYVAAGTKLAEAKKKLIHRYELVTKDVKEQTLADVYAGFLNAFSNALDPHSTYFSADDLVDFRISMDLSLEGIGAQLSSRDGYTIVREVIPGGAADRQGGLKRKDKVIAVAQGENGEPVNVVDMPLRKVVKLIRGKKGTKVKLTILRQRNKAETHHFLITRDKIDLKESAAKLEWKTIERDRKKLKIAVIRLPSFYGGDPRKGARDCTADMKKLLVEVAQKKADGLMLDLSRNGGGLLKASVDISGLFLATGPVVAIAGPATGSKQVLEDTDKTINFAGPMVVATSRVSASASEILAGALKDYRRALIVGVVHTFGKGTVQNIVSLPLGFGALKVTTAHFFRPGGQSTQNEGVAADIIVPSRFNNEDYGERHQPYALPPKTIEAFRGTKVNVNVEGQRWLAITDSDIKTLNELSLERQKTNAELLKVKKELDKARKNKGIIKISEILDDPERSKKDDEDEDDEDDKKLSPQSLEALEVLGDLIMRQR